MFEQFLAPESLPFAIALSVVGGLFVLELASSFLGLSFLGVGTDAPDLDVEMDFDLSVDADFDLDVDAEAIDTPSGLLGWIGAKDVPFLIWLVSFLTMFGLIGLVLQSITGGLPVLVAVLITILPALAVTRVIANWVALIMPKTETSAIRKRFLGGSRGTITQGTARRDKPAEAKVKDRHGNIHYLRVEPLHDGEAFEQGSDVTLIRKRGDKFYVI